MLLHKLVRRNHGGKSLVSIKNQNLYSFKEGVILLHQSILETRRISHLHGSALFTIPLRSLRSSYINCNIPFAVTWKYYFTVLYEGELRALAFFKCVY